MATTTRVGTRDTADGTRMFRTKNDLPAATRAEIVGLLNQRLADAIDLQTMCKQAHWNVKGPQFIALHKLFDDVNEAVAEYVDLIAERIVQLGGVAEGTVRAGAERTALAEYPLTLSRARTTSPRSRTFWHSSGEPRGSGSRR